MKKLFLCLLLLVVGVLFLACSSNKPGINKSNKKIEVGLVIGTNGIDDGAFNQNTWEGIVDFFKDNNIPEDNTYYVHSFKEDEYLTNLIKYAEKKPDVIVAPGYYFVEPLQSVSKKYADQKFVLLDGVVDSLNVASITFAHEEGGFLAGVIAAKKAKMDGYDTIGFLGGADIPLLHPFEVGFRYGAYLIEPNIKVVVEYADDFTKPKQGEEIANKMYDDGAYVIFNTAGVTGNGLIKAARERTKKGENLWVIGIDKDQYLSGVYEEGKSIILTSIMKKLDVAVYDMLKAVKRGDFRGGHIIYSLKNNGVGLPLENPNLSSEIYSEIEKYKQDIIDGNLLIPENEEQLKQLIKNK